MLSGSRRRRARGPFPGCILLAALAAGPAVAAAADPWVAAIRAGDAAALSALATPGADPERSGPDGKTALMVAASRGDLALIERLLALGADVDRRNRGGGTALMYAAQYGQLEATRALLAAGAGVDLQGINGWSALGVAVLKGHADVIAVLLERGADPNVRDMVGWTPLMRAVREGRDGAALRLLDEPRTAVNAANPDGATALHLAAALDRGALIDALLARGADAGARDAEGHTPAERAAAEGHGALAARLGAAAGAVR